jgi:hypothetical protein
VHRKPQRRVVLLNTPRVRTSGGLAASDCRGRDAISSPTVARSKLSSTQAWHEGCQCRPKQNPPSNGTLGIWLERSPGSPRAKTNQFLEPPATCEAASVTVGQQIRGGSPDQEHHQAHHSGRRHEQHRHRPPPRHDRSVGPRGRGARGPPASTRSRRDQLANAIKRVRTTTLRPLYDRERPTTTNARWPRILYRQRIF